MHHLMMIWAHKFVPWVWNARFSLRSTTTNEKSSHDTKKKKHKLWENGKCSWWQSDCELKIWWYDMMDILCIEITNAIMTDSTTAVRVVSGQTPT